jgi:opine dehydrogenase
MKICVIGSGNGGCAIAAYLSSKGYIVNLFNRSFSNIRPIMKKGAITVTGEINGTFPIELATINLERAVKGTDMILIATPASSHKEIALKIARYLTQDQIIILNPGRCFGALEFYTTIKKKRKDISVHVAETQTLVFTCRKTGETEVEIIKIKDSVDFCAFPESDNSIIYDIVKEIFPQFYLVDDYLEVTLNNVGMLLHPTITLLNASPIDGKRPFLFYKEGATKRICEMIEHMQLELSNIFQNLGVSQISLRQWAKRTYGVDSNDIYSAFQSIKEYDNIFAPKELATRYFLEDIPTGLVSMSSLGNALGIKTPIIDSIINLSSILCGIDFNLTGRNVENLDIMNYIKQRKITTLMNEVNKEQIDEFIDV